MSNTTSLYSTTTSGNVTIPPNNNTGLYNATGVPATVDNNINITGNISAAGNITGGNILTEGIVSAAGNIYAANFIGNISGNLVVPGGNTQIIYNNNGAANASANLTFNAATDVLTVTGQITATGNVAGNYILGDGSLLTNLPAGNYSNANVTALMAAFGANTVSTTGNVTAGYFLGDGSQLTNLPAGNYSNANVAAYLPTYTGNITGQQVSLLGNVIASYVIGDGSQLTNLPAGNYSNANVAAYLPTYTGNLTANTITATGNVSAQFFVGNGSQLTGVVTNYSNANVTSLMAAFGSNSISTSGNVTAGNFAGNGTGLTSITGANVTGTVALATFANTAGTANTANTATSAITAGTVTTNAQPNITSVGTLTTVTSTGNITGGNILTGGAVSAAGNVSGLFIKGDGSQLTNLPLGNYSNANVAAYLPVYTGNIAAGNVSATGNITAAFLKTSGNTGNITGVNYVSANFYLGDGGYLSNIQASNLVGVVSQANISNLVTVSNANSTSSTGFYVAFASGPGNTQIQVDNVGNGLTYTPSTGKINLTAIEASGQILGNSMVSQTTISATGNITGSYFIGNGSQLTGLPAGYSNADVNAHLAAFGSNVISTSGNITAGNITATGVVYTPQVESAGDLDLNTTGQVNVNGNIRVGDNNTDTQIATHGAGDLLITTHAGNATQGNIRLYEGANGNIDVTTNGTGTINLSGAVRTTDGVTAQGNVTAGNIMTSGAISATGNVTGNYFFGNGSQLTGITTAAGGTDGQIQFNSGTAFAGNTNLSFNSLTGDIVLGNLVVNGLEILPGNLGNALNSVNIGANVTDYQLRIGNSYNGNTNWAMTSFAGSGNTVLGVGARVLQSDTWDLSNTSGRLSGLVAQNYVNIQGNINNGATRFQAGGSFLAIGGGASGNTISTTNTVFPVQAWGSAITVGNVNANLNIGNTTISYVNGQLFTGQVANGSQANYMTVMGGTIVNSGATANIGNVIGYHINWNSSSGGNVTNFAVYYHSGNTSNNTILPPVTTGNIARAATNYFAFRNDDDLAKSRLGSLEKMHYFTSNVAIAAGNITVNKNNGQVQNLYMTENVTGVTFSNFVTRTQKPDSTQVNQTDIVTLVVQQGATPYTLTLPTGNANIRYANALSVVGNTANSTTLIQITGLYNYNANATQYLINIGDEYT